jgi:hypothetical protein
VRFDPPRTLQIVRHVTGEFSIVDGESVSQPLTFHELMGELVLILVATQKGPRYMQEPDDIVRHIEFRARRRAERESAQTTAACPF